jgi:hypothetical protein
MLVRIRFGKPLKVGKRRRKNQRFALALGAMMTPVALMALVLAAWRLAADLNWTKSFAIASGPFSHWQVWLGLGILVQLLSRALNRYGNGEDSALS